MTIETDIKNYYESLVVDEIFRVRNKKNLNENDYDDIACVALNNLPARYYRYSVDLAFYMSTTERTEIFKKVEKVVGEAVKFVQEHAEDKR